MEPHNIRKLSYKDLASYTKNFCESNYIGRCQFGKLYRGVLLNCKWTVYMLVKIWEVPEIYDYDPGDNEVRPMEELILLRHEMLINHPCMVKLYGYCCEDLQLGVAYEFKPYDSVFNLIPKDGFTWLQRIKAALGLASVVKFLHSGNSSSYKPFVIRNLDAAHIVLDEEYNAKLCDFAWICGGIFPDGRTCSGHNAVGCYGYIDNTSASDGDDCSSKQDVFAFGVILLSLIAKKAYTEVDRQAGAPFVYEWALSEYESEGDTEKTNFSPVHESLTAECLFCPADGHTITMMALECVNRDESQRPNMKQVFRFLRKLEVVKQHTDFLGVDKLLLPRF